MRFDRNTYMRLRHIAFFMPDLFYGEKEYKSEYMIGYPNTYPFDDKDINEIIYSMRFSVASLESGSDYLFFQNLMRIDHFEIILFRVCIFAYLNLEPLFSQYKDSINPPNEYNNKGIDKKVDNPVVFYKSIPENDISGDEIKEKSYGMFHSVKSAWSFLCNFMPSVSLYDYSLLINKYKEDIPLLAYIKKDIAQFLCKYPIGSFVRLNELLSNWADALEIYSKCKESIKTLNLQGIDKLYGEYLLKIVHNRINMFCFDISNFLSNKAGALGFDFYFYTDKKIDPIDEKEKNRREGISKSHKNRLSERRVQIERIKKEIFNKSRSEKTSIKKACERYYEDHKNELNSFRIVSPRTLQNICSNTKPNKQRSAFSNMVYIKPDYSKGFQEKIDLIYKKIKKE